MNFSISLKYLFTRLILSVIGIILYIISVWNITEESKNNVFIMLGLIALGTVSITTMGFALGRLSRIKSLGQLRWDICKDCWHPKEKHRGGSGGDWWGSKYHSGECVDGAYSDGYYRTGGCRCYTFEKQLFPVNYVEVAPRVLPEGRSGKIL